MNQTARPSMPVFLSLFLDTRGVVWYREERLGKYRSKREEMSVYLEPVDVDEQQKLTQDFKAIILQLKKRKRKLYWLEFNLKIMLYYQNKMKLLKGNFILINKCLTSSSNILQLLIWWSLTFWVIADGLCCLLMLW